MQIYLEVTPTGLSGTSEKICIGLYYQFSQCLLQPILYLLVSSVYFFEKCFLQCSFPPRKVTFSLNNYVEQSHTYLLRSKCHIVLYSQLSVDRISALG